MAHQGNFLKTNNVSMPREGQVKAGQIETVWLQESSKDVLKIMGYVFSVLKGMKNTKS